MNLWRVLFHIGSPLRVEVNMNIRSMGPISETDMVGEITGNSGLQLLIYSKQYPIV